MNIYCLTSLLGFIQNAIAYIDIKGELSFDWYPIGGKVLRNVEHNNISIENGAANELGATGEVGANETKPVNTTSADDCVYQFPNRKQVEALLSDMMNQLTKIFVRSYEYMSRRNTKRFKIVRPKFDSRFFEEAYNLMSKEYRESINVTANISRLSSHDPCHHQLELKEIWRNLLEHSKAILKKAAVRCVSDFLRVRNRADDTRAKEKLGQLLLREITEVRSNQIKVLCDTFKLCFKDLLF